MIVCTDESWSDRWTESKHHVSDGAQGHVRHGALYCCFVLNVGVRVGMTHRRIGWSEEGVWSGDVTTRDCSWRVARAAAAAVGAVVQVVGGQVWRRQGHPDVDGCAFLRHFNDI